MKITLTLQFVDTSTGEILGQSKRLITDSNGAFYDVDLYFNKWYASFKRGLKKYPSLCLQLTSAPFPVEKDFF